MTRSHLSLKPVSASLAKRFGACAVALASLALASQASAEIITFNGPIGVPSTFDGLYINLATGATGGLGSATPGWDFNPYNSGTSLSFFWNGTPANSSGGVATAATGGQYIDLGLGSTISAASTFTAITAAAATAQFQPAGNHILGFRFFNEGTGAINYGYMFLTSGGSNGFPLTIQSWSYENSGGAITVVPEPATALMLGAGALALGAMRLRRQRGEAA